jgi:hypothetical protein
LYSLPGSRKMPAMMEFVAQRLILGDVVLIDLPGETGVRAKVVRQIERTETTVRATLHIDGREDFVREWPLGELVAVVQGP